MRGTQQSPCGIICTGRIGLRDGKIALLETSLTQYGDATIGPCSQGRWIEGGQLWDVDMVLLTIASIAAGLFAGAAVYINAVEHPARVSCGTEIAVQEFGPSYRRATVMQASLAIVGGTCGLLAGWQQQDMVVVVGALLVAGVVPFTLLIIAPTNSQLLDPTLDRSSPRAKALLKRWARLHAVRSVMSSVGFCTFLVRLAAG